MHFIINIGNTHTQVAVMEENGLPRLLQRYDTPDLIAAQSIPIINATQTPWMATASSVVPRLTEILRNTYHGAIHFLTHNDFPQIDFSLMNTATLGMDRICNAAAAMLFCGHGPVIVLDCGTCLVTEALDAHNRFCGGAIMPGRMILRRSLADYTAQLPLVDLQFSRPSPLGTDTPHAILAGVDLGILCNVRQLVIESRLALNAPDCKVLVTGGDARFFLENIPELTEAPELMTLRGVCAAARRESDC